MTKREYFAALALQGMLADNSNKFSHLPYSLGEKAVIFADKLIEALNEEKEND